MWLLDIMNDTLDTSPSNTISFQGELGAYSHMACQAKYPGMNVMACASFDDALEAVQKGHARLAMIPIENSTAGRVADIHMLLPGSGLYIIGEHFETIRHCLLASKDVTDTDLKHVMSHVQALSQCKNSLRAMDLTPHTSADTAGSAKNIAEQNLRDTAAVASALAADVYDLRIVKADIQDEGNNTTRFVILSQTENDVSTLSGDMMTSFTFEVKNVPAALYKALGGFATNAVNMTKLESYYESDSFTATEFYADIMGYEGLETVRRAMEELRFQTKHVRMLGTYPSARKRR